jgi:hypothetical protein
MNKISKNRYPKARKFLFAIVLAFASTATVASGQSDSSKADTKLKPPTVFWPEGVEHSDEITSPRKFLKFRIGQRHLDHSQLVRYLRQIASESDRIELEQYGTTHGGRPENLARLARIRRDHKFLATPSQSSKVQLDDLPAVINMGYGVHGDEASATNCSALVAHYLAAAKGDEIENWLDQCVILLDPSLNPDGFNRFANWVNDHRGRVLNPNKQHREHNQPWPSGRVNYYWFDLNRDWLPLEHPESRSRMKWYHAWKPNVVLDFHEMGTNSTYFFQPGVPKRTNPMTPLKNLELTAKFGEYHGEALDSRGSLYFTKELFDDFYMGKGSTYPDLHGAVGILFEQASARGHVQKNQDGLLRFHDAIANHFSTSLSSLKATSDMRVELLEYKKSFYEKSIKRATKRNTSAVVFTGVGNPARLQRFAQTLMRHDIQCYRPKTKGAIGGKVLSPDSLVVPFNQPEYRFLQSLMMRRKDFEENIFYDVSAWTLPLAYGLQQSSLKDELDFDLLEKETGRTKSAVEFTPDDHAVAYAVDWRCDNAVTLLNELLSKDISVRVATRPFTAANPGGNGDLQFEQGTLVIPIGIQAKKRKQIEGLLKKAARNHVTSHPLMSGLNQKGSDLGSNRFKKIAKPKVLMAAGRNVSQYGAGEIWHLLDVIHSIQLTISDNPGKVDLQAFSTMVFPPGRYGQMQKSDWKAVADRIRSGGTAIAIGPSCELIQTALTNQSDKETSKARPEANSKGKAEDAEKPDIQLAFDSAADTQALQLVSGAIFQTVIDRTHPLFYGFPEGKLPVFRNHTKFLKPSKNPYCNPGIYDSKNPHLAGYCSEENRLKFTTSASVVVTPIGQGRLIQISDSPNFRAFWHGTSRVLMNGLFFGEFSDPPTPRNE